MATALTPRLTSLPESHVTDGEPEAVVSASLQKIKSIKNPVKHFIFYFIKSETSLICQSFRWSFCILKRWTCPLRTAGRKVTSDQCIYWQAFRDARENTLAQAKQTERSSRFIVSFATSQLGRARLVFDVHLVRRDSKYPGVLRPLNHYSYIRATA